MANKLVIVESPHKAKTIRGYLGSEYEVTATMGHIRDLAVGDPSCHLGVKIENDFEPIYQILKGKSKVVSSLKHAVKEGKEIYLATDPDREGEAISWHIADELGLDINNTKRLEFHEVTYHAIKDAIENPRTINMDLVHSQETRRIIDRILGFKLSNLLKSKIGTQSAGRVQSVVVKLIVERQKEVDAFESKEYYKVTGSLLVDGNSVNVTLVDSNKNEIHFDDVEKANEVIEFVKENPIKVYSIENKECTRSSKPVYTTSTMQQDASIHLKMDSKHTMAYAQALYESGYITYMRTDSIRITPSFINKVKEYIKNAYGENYVGTAKVFSGNKDNVQDAHEGIRPTDISITPDDIVLKIQSENEIKDSDKEGAIKLYKLIYNRTLTSIMKDEVYNHEDVMFSCKDNYLLAEGETKLFDGFTIIDNSTERKPFEKEITNDSVVQYHKLGEKQGKTKGPSPFTEATLIHQMEKDGIGRPSTYATTIETIKTRKFIEVNKYQFIPTDQGILTVEKLEESFTDYIDIGYTANMETSLDEIAEGKLIELDYLKEFYSKFKDLLDRAKDEMEQTVCIPVPDLTDYGVCPKCGKPLAKKTGKYGEFLACIGFPKCKTIVPLGKPCPICKDGTLVKKKGPHGFFFGCSNYPKCTHIEPISSFKPKFYKKKAD